MAHAGQKIRLRLVGFFRHRHGIFQFQLDLLAHGVVGAYQQVADDVAVVIAQRRDGHDRRETAAVLADIGQLVDVFNPARGLEGQGFKARRDGGGELKAQRLRPCHHFFRVMDVAGVDLVDDLFGQVAQHQFGAHIKKLNDAFFVGGNDGEVGAGQDCVLQCAGFKQGFLAAYFDDAVCLGDGIRKGKTACCLGHGRFL
ncbi:hypothetical protein D9M73_146340 [compost metagenome]